jgi:hypothetical protein
MRQTNNPPDCEDYYLCAIKYFYNIDCNIIDTGNNCVVGIYGNIAPGAANYC